MLVTELSAQTTRTVCASGCNYTTIQAAMTAAVSGDTILLNVTGIFTEKDIILPEKNLVLKGLGKGITILQSAATAASASGGRIFTYVDPTGAGGNSFRVENMTIQNGYAPVDVNNQAIGAVFYGKAPKGLKLSFNNVRMYNNQTKPGSSNNSGGGCIYISATGTGFTYNADLSLTNCDFDDNYLGNPVTNSWGACISMLGSPARLTADNCSFNNNSAYNGGGVMYCGSNWVIYIKNSKFDNNTYRSSGDGGCFKGTSGNWNFDNCLFTNNKSLAGTGFGGVWSGSGAKFKSCTFFNNEAVKGGAIYRAGSGFVVNGNAEMQIINCSFYGNKASSTGKTIHYGGTSPTATMPLVLINSIITGGTGAATSDFHFTLPYAQLTTNLKNYCTSIGTEHATPGTTPVFDFNAGNTTLGLSGTLATNGGSFQSLALSNTSTLINAGTNVTGSSYDIGIKDQRNYARTDGAIDVGSFEYNGIADDASGPSIVYTPLANTLLTTDRNVTATITDVNGVYWYPQTTDYRPRIYFKKNTGAWMSAAGSPLTGNGINGTWSFTISSAAMGSLANGDIVSYYIIAQDVSSIANIMSDAAGVNASDVNTIATPPAAASYIIGSTLAVKLKSFIAKVSGSNCLLEWIVGEQVNVANYQVEKSAGGSNWSSVATISANNSSLYQVTDKGIANGTHYYRIKITDIDGKVTYSESKSIKFSMANGVFRILSNKVENGFLEVQVSQKTHLSLFESNGKKLWAKQLVPGLQRINVGSYPKGIYFLKGDGTAQRIQIQ